MQNSRVKSENMLFEIIAVLTRLHCQVKVLPECRVINVKRYLLDTFDELGGSCSIVDQDLENQANRCPWQSGMSGIIIDDYISYLDESLNPGDDVAEARTNIDLTMPCRDLPFRGCMLSSLFNCSRQVFEAER